MCLGRSKVKGQHMAVLTSKHQAVVSMASVIMSRQYTNLVSAKSLCGKSGRICYKNKSFYLYPIFAP